MPDEETLCFFLTDGFHPAGGYRLYAARARPE